MILSSARIGWQTTLADLALILFMVTAAAMADRPDRAEHAPPAAVNIPQSGEPLAIYRPAPDAPPLRDWLAGQARDERQHLTIISRYPRGMADDAAAGALALATDATAAGHSPRIVVEPGQAADLVAVLDFDGRQSGTPIADTRVATSNTKRAAEAVPNER